MNPERLFEYIVYAGLGLTVSGWVSALGWRWLFDEIRNVKRSR